jgi:hypothetical protein
LALALPRPSLDCAHCGIGRPQAKLRQNRNGETLLPFKN